MLVRVDSEEEGKNSRGIEGGEGDAMHGEEGPGEARKGSVMGARGKGRAMENGVESV